MANVTAAAVFPISGTNGTTTGSNYATTPAASGTFIPTLWSAKLNVKFYAASTFAAISNTDWQGDISGLGDKVIINNIPTISVNDYSIGSNLTYQTPAPSTLELVIDKGKSFAFALSDVIAYQAQPNLMDTFSNDAAEQMRVAIDADCWRRTVSLFLAAPDSTGNFGATAGVKSGAYNMGTDAAPVTLTATNVLQKILEMASILDEQNVPESDRWLVIDPYTRTLLMQSNLAQAQFMGDSTSIVRNGMIGKIDRFTVYVSNQLPAAAAGQGYPPGFGGATPTVGGALKRRAIFAGHKCAISFASQMTKTETLRNPNDFGDLVRGLQVFGLQVVKGSALVMMQVA